MKVTIVGTHGIPARYGGFETFAEHLAKHCANAGIEVKVVNEKSNPGQSYPGIEVVTSSFNKGDSPLKFYRDSLKIAADSDIILCCGVGGSRFYNRKYLESSRIVTNIDGLEHRRGRYSLLQRIFVYISQRWTARRSDAVVADCVEIWGYWTKRFDGVTPRTKMIAYGAEQCLPFDEKVLEKYKLVKQEYFLVIARLVPENNISEIISAFGHYLGKKKLVIVGAKEKTKYVQRLKQSASDKVIFTGAIFDKQELDSLRQGCFVYIHGHTVGGTNPSLLEAMAAGCACLCHENVFNREVTEGGQMYFDSGFELSIMLNLLEHKTPDLDSFRNKALSRVHERYSWEKSCSLYIELFNKLYQGKKMKSQHG